MTMQDMNQLWEKKAGLLQAFLELTKTVSDLLCDEGSEDRFQEIEQCLKKRADIISKVTEMGTLKADGDASEETKKWEWLCNELLGQIQVLEEENVGHMNRILERFQEKMRANRQDRDTINAYSKQMENTTEEGRVLDHSK